MTATELITTLQVRGIKLEAQGDRLRYRPASAVTPELLKALAAHKVEILSLLREKESKNLHYALQERAVFGVTHIEDCLVGCGAKVEFYQQDSEALGYCKGCDVHQRIVTRPI
jgi:hypothetical protein